MQHTRARIVDFQWLIVHSTTGDCLRIANPDLHDHFTLVSELDGITYKIYDDLAQPSRIANQRHWHVGQDVANQFQILSLSSTSQGLDCFIHAVTQVKLNRIEIEFTCLDF